MQNAVKKNIVDGNFWNKETLEIVSHNKMEKKKVWKKIICKKVAFF